MTVGQMKKALECLPDDLEIEFPGSSAMIRCSDYEPQIDMSYPHTEHYLVRYEHGGYDVCSYSNVNQMDTRQVGRPRWHTAQFRKVEAWMPLPKEE